MAYKQSPGRMNMPKTGKNLPLSMVSPFYQDDIKIKPGTKKVDRKKRKETSQQMAQAVLAGENVEGYTKSGRTKLEVFKKGDIIDTKGRKGGTYGKGTGRSTADVSGLSEKKLTKQINRQLRKAGSVSVKDGVVEGGVTITKPMTEAQKEKKAALDKKRAQSQVKKAENQKISATNRAKLIAEREVKKSANAIAREEIKNRIKNKKEKS